jgi:hypothetical protein
MENQFSSQSILEEARAESQLLDLLLNRPQNPVARLGIEYVRELLAQTKTSLDELTARRSLCLNLIGRLQTGVVLREA